MSSLKALQGRPDNVLGTPRINLTGTSLERQIKASPGRHFRTFLGLQIGTSPGRSNRIFRGRPGDAGGGRPRDVLGTNICRLDSDAKKLFISQFFKQITLCLSVFSKKDFLPQKMFILWHLLEQYIQGVRVFADHFLSTQLVWVFLK